MNYLDIVKYKYLVKKFWESENVFTENLIPTPQPNPTNGKSIDEEFYIKNYLSENNEKLSFTLDTKYGLLQVLKIEHNYSIIIARMLLENSKNFETGKIYAFDLFDLMEESENVENN